MTTHPRPQLSPNYQITPSTPSPREKSPITAAPTPPAANGVALCYFPQGHAEQATATLDLSGARVPALLAYRISVVRFIADTHSDKEGGGRTPKVGLLRKTLTQSDAKNGWGFSVPRFCTETIFPALDYSSESPVKGIVIRDVLGDEFKFRHIYRGTPLRHLLTTY
ncbi:Auxin response factor 10 [Hordeum vulgare]|nr:Auxin response factor 10 [Hordeum vulgare]